MICLDSRNVKKGDTFVAIKGFAVDGHDYALKAQENGAIEIVAEHEIAGITVPIRIVQNSRKEAARLAAEYYNNPTKSLKLIGITGTNGKTTTTYMVKHILESIGKKVGLIGTNQNMIGQEVLHTERTTPESIELQELFAKMRDEGCEYVVMEVSSHALSLDRVASSQFEVAAFTNLTQDHLDFHKDMQDYFEAKCLLFPMAKKAVINEDDEWGKKIVGDNLSFVNKEMVRDSLAENHKIVGEFNLSNAAVAYGICKALGMDESAVKKGLEAFQGVKGRMEVVYNKDFQVIIDYAHTPDGLENILKSANEFKKGRLVALFGCGGDRDPIKRPIMGGIAEKFADFCIVTSDNPRTENPGKIIEYILQGMNDESKRIVIENRLEAIKWGFNNAKKGDVLILAGKGHEDYQIIGKEKFHFDEHEIIEELSCN